MFGPLYYYELVRLSRKGGNIAVRCGYALVTLATLFFVFRDRFPDYNPFLHPFAVEAAESRQLARLAHDFVTAVLVVQTVAILVLTPAYLAGSVAGEKERGTLDLLFTTHLTDREIVLGKLAAAATNLGGVLLAGLPLLAVTQLWGGVDLSALLAAFVAAGFNVLCVGSLSILCSALFRTTYDALANAYAVVVMYLFVLAFFCFAIRPFATTAVGVFVEDGPFVPLATCVAVDGVITAIAIRLAIAVLRPDEPDRRTAATPVVPAPTKARAKKASAGRQVQLQFSPVGEWPLLWREINPTANARGERFLDRYWPALVLVAALLGCLLSVDLKADLHDGFERIILGFLILMSSGIVWCWAVSISAAMSVCREREQKTLDTLLALPVSRSTIAGAKWLGAILRGRTCYLPMIVTAFVAGVGLSHPLRALLLPMTLAAHIAFLASLGLRVSVVSRTALRARVTMTLLLLVFFAAGWVALAVDSEALKTVDVFSMPSNGNANMPTAEPPQLRAVIYTVGLNPIGGWAFLSGLRRPDPDPALDRQFERTHYAVAACGALVYASAAGLLWLDARRRLRPE
jgi:ABC-type Na+ efflux pump permease subunit